MSNLNKRLVSKILLLVILLTPIASLKGVEASSQKGQFEIFEHNVRYDLSKDLSTVKYGVDDFDMDILSGEITYEKLEQAHKEYERIVKQIHESPYKKKLENIYLQKMNNIIGPNLKQVGSFKYLDPLNSLKYTIYLNLKYNTWQKGELKGRLYTTPLAPSSFSGFTDPSKYDEYEKIFVETIKSIEEEIEFKNEKPFVALVPIEDKKIGGAAFAVGGCKGTELYVNCMGDRTQFIHAISHEVGHILSTEFAGDSGVSGFIFAVLDGLSGKLPLLKRHKVDVEKVFADIYNGFASQESFESYSPLPIDSLEKIKKYGIYGYGVKSGWAYLPGEHFADSIAVYFTDKIVGEDTPIYTAYKKNNAATEEFLRLRGQRNCRLDMNLEVKEVSRDDSIIKFKLKAKGGILTEDPIQEHSLEKGKSIGVQYIDSNGNIDTARIRAVVEDGQLVLASNPKALLVGDDNIIAIKYEEKVKFKDLRNNFWAYDEIYSLAEKDLIKGYEDGTFRPLNKITRSEFSKIIAEFLPESLDRKENKFKDLDKSHWAYSHMNRAVNAGILKGYEDGSLKPNKEITRDEAAVIIMRLLEYKKVNLSNKGARLEYKDQEQIRNWSKDAIDSLSSEGIITGVGNGYFAPRRSINRAEVAVIINRSLEKYNLK